MNSFYQWHKLLRSPLLLTKSKLNPVSSKLWIARRLQLYDYLVLRHRFAMSYKKHLPYTLYLHYTQTSIGETVRSIPISFKKPLTCLLSWWQSCSCHNCKVSTSLTTWHSFVTEKKFRFYSSTNKTSYTISAIQLPFTNILISMLPVPYAEFSSPFATLTFTVTFWATDKATSIVFSSKNVHWRLAFSDWIFFRPLDPTFFPYVRWTAVTIWLIFFQFLSLARGLRF